MFEYHEVLKISPPINEVFTVGNLDSFLRDVRYNNILRINKKSLFGKDELMIRKEDQKDLINYGYRAYNEINRNQKYLNIYTIYGLGNVKLKYEILNYENQCIILDIYKLEGFRSDDEYLQFGINNYVNQFYRHTLLRDFVLIYLFFKKDIYDKLKEDEKYKVIEFNFLYKLLSNGIPLRLISWLKQYTYNTIQNENYILDRIMKPEITSDSTYIRSLESRRYLINLIHDMGYLNFMKALHYEDYTVYDRCKVALHYIR